ncbi:Methionine aminopeptidase [Chitinispirillum alkaliphilum]|nr:Methionine aminopeptidase [Chitinispirillum alkaliphilum]
MFSDQDRAKGKSSPAPAKKRFVKNSEQIGGMRKAGEFNGVLMDYIRPHVKEGVSTEEINRLAHDFTLSHGHTPACLGYRGYPKSVCTSRNNVVCHGIPSPEEILRDGDIVNVDLTTIVNGYYGDSSETFFIGEVSEDAAHLVDVTARALLLGIDAVRPGASLRAIAEAIEPFVKSQGCSVVKQYTGHGIGLNFHEDYTVYHHLEPYCEHIVMEPGMTFTIEPMVNLGGYQVVTDKKDKWTVRTKDGSLSAQFEHTIAVTDDGAEILTLTPFQRAKGIRLHVDGKDFQ